MTKWKVILQEAVVRMNGAQYRIHIDSEYGDSHKKVCWEVWRLNAPAAGRWHQGAVEASVAKAKAAALKAIKAHGEE